MKRRILILLLALAAGINARAVEIADPNLHFSFTLPNGFIDNPNAHPEAPVLRCLYLPSKTDDPMDALFVSAKDFGMPIKQESLLQSQVPVGLLIEHTRWQEFDLDIIRKEEQLNGATVVDLIADIPLTPHAIRIVFVGKKAHAAQLEDLMRSTIASVQGETSWRSTDNGWVRWLKGFNGLLATLAIAVSVVLILRKVTRRTVLQLVFAKSARLAAIGRLCGGMALQLSARLVNDREAR